MPTPRERLRSAGRAAAMGSITFSMMYAALLHVRTRPESQRYTTKQRWMRSRVLRASHASPLTWIDSLRF